MPPQVEHHTILQTDELGNRYRPWLLIGDLNSFASATVVFIQVLTFMKSNPQAGSIFFFQNRAQLQRPVLFILFEQMIFNSIGSEIIQQESLV